MIEIINDFQRHFDRFQKQIRRITGQKNTVDALRLHSFGGSLENCRFLREKGVKTLLQPMMTVQAIILMGFKWNN